MQVSEARFLSLHAPVRASAAKKPALDQVELSGAPPEPVRETIPPTLLEEVRQVFSPPSDEYSSGRSCNQDSSRDTGVEVDHRSGGGGCFGPSEHYWTVKMPGEKEPEQIAIGAGVLSSASGCSVNSDGTFVVGRFGSVRKDERRDEDLRTLRDKGLYNDTESWRSADYLVDVPLKKGFFGKLPATMRRKGWMPQKVLTALPPDAGAFDVAPDKSVAIAQNDRVLRWTRKHGLEPWLQLSRKVQDLEYLSDGSLAVLTTADVGSDIYVFRRGKEQEPLFVPFAQAFPKDYESRLRSSVSGLRFLSDASVPELEKFLKNSAWIKTEERWRRWEDNSSYGNAVVLWKKEAPELWSYDRSQGTARPLGFLTMPPSERLEKPDRFRFEAEATEDGRFLVARSRPKKTGEPLDLAVWDLEKGGVELIPGVREVQLDAAQSSVSVQILTGEQRTIPLAGVSELKKEDWYRKALLADLLDSDGELKPDQQIGEDAQKIIVGGVHVKKKD